MNPRILLALVAGLLYLLHRHPQVTLLGHAAPTIILVASVEAPVTVVLLRLCWRSLRGALWGAA